MTATVHLLHGLPGCGKTRYAKQLAAERPCVHLSHDEWIVRVFGPQPTSAQMDLARQPVHEMLWTYASRIVSAGSDVVLDFGFWTRRDRDEARERVQRAGAAHRLYTFECSPQLAWERVKHRNRVDAADSLHIDEPTFWLIAGRVEAVAPDEDRIVVPG